MMKKEAYDRFMSKMSSEFGNVDSVKEFLLDAEELAKYGEKRVKSTWKFTWKWNIYFIWINKFGGGSI